MPYSLLQQWEDAEWGRLEMLEEQYQREEWCNAVREPETDRDHVQQKSCAQENGRGDQRVSRASRFGVKVRKPNHGLRKPELLRV